MWPVISVWAFAFVSLSALSSSSCLCADVALHALTSTKRYCGGSVREDTSCCRGCVDRETTVTKSLSGVWLSLSSVWLSGKPYDWINNKRLISTGKRKKRSEKMNRYYDTENHRNAYYWHISPLQIIFHSQLLWNDQFVSQTPLKRFNRTVLVGKCSSPTQPPSAQLLSASFCVSVHCCRTLVCQRKWGRALASCQIHSSITAVCF